MKLALLQMDIAYGDAKKNQDEISKYFSNLSHHVNTVVLPEMWNVGYDLRRLDEIGDFEGRVTQEFLSNLANKYTVNIVGGSIAKIDERGYSNTMYVIDHSGNLITEYGKAHLFLLMDEKKYLVEGNSRGGFELDSVPSAGVICYDIRFPEWIRTHVLEGAQVIYVVAQWPKPRIDHWRTLLIARAIENQCFVVACNRVGKDPNNEFGGHSMVINPWGEVLCEASSDEKILTATIDLTQVEQARKHIPIFEDRREDLYK
ncbi:carbon-nitrogen family hydrolase [Alkalibacillus aidingensis]|uniref:carbon-nitrogen family hydrolase n=1 Tax=Alkalibacillus aidingensis TaxID=2747607 RepID=UPI001660DDD2|nr:carbon-nitrogen family hydrolase [Alkalibacillus aidingensis]